MILLTYLLLSRCTSYNVCLFVCWGLTCLLVSVVLSPLDFR